MTAQQSRLDELEKELVKLAGKPVSVRRLSPISGGASMEIWAYVEDSNDGERPLILRLRREGESEIFETSISLKSEARLLELARDAGVPVPEVVYKSPSNGKLGDAYVMTQIFGETFGRKIAAGSEFSSARKHLGAQCGEALARIHSISKRELPDLEHLNGEATLARYEDIYRSGSRLRPVLEAAIKWLQRTMPAHVEPVFVHGDFRNGNLMVNPESGLVGVLDWELAHLGDPAEDLGWLCVNSWRFGVKEQTVGGFASLEELLDAYVGAGGVAPSMARIRWWQAMGSFKWAVIAMMMYRTFASGNSDSIERVVIGRRVSEAEADLLHLMEAS